MIFQPSFQGLVKPQSVSVFDPNTMANLQNRFETNAITGISDGSAIPSLTDLKGSATCTATSGQQPLYRLSGKYAEFTNHTFLTNITNTFGNFAAIAVVRMRNLTATYQRIIDKAYDTGFWLGGGSSANTLGGGVRESNPPYGSYQSAAANTWYVALIERNGTTKRIRLAGAQATATVSATALSSVPLYIGSEGGSTTYAAMDFKALFIFNSALNSTDDSNLANYFLNTYGLTY